jgi:hypothetical protein
VETDKESGVETEEECGVETVVTSNEAWRSVAWRLMTEVLSSVRFRRELQQLLERAK